MVTKRDDDDDRQGEYRAICLWKMDWQSFAINWSKVFNVVESEMSLKFYIFYPISPDFSMNQPKNLAKFNQDISMIPFHLLKLFSLSWVVDYYISFDQ